MFKLFDRNHNAVDILDGYKNCYIEETLKTGLKTLSFSISSTHPLASKIEEEGYLQTADSEFVIKEYNKTSNDFYEVFAKDNIEELEGTPLQKFEALTNSVEGTVGLALAHVPTWSFEDLSGITKRRTLRKENGTVYDIIDYCRSVYGVEIEYRTLEKKVIIHNKRGTDRGVFLTNEHDMSQFQVQSTSYDFITRLYPYGADDENGNPINISSVNGGLTYIDDNRYSDKVVAAIWIDQRYKIPQNLLDDAREKLYELAQPAHSYSATVITLGIRDIKIGDTVTFMDSLKKTREKQRVVKITHYPFEPEKDKVELSNTKLSFADKIAALDSAAQLIDDNTDDAGNITYAEKAGTGGGGGGGGEIPDPLKVNKIIAAEADLGKVTASDITSTDLFANNGEIVNLKSADAVIKKLEADDIKAKFGIQTDSITVTGAYIGTLTNDNFTSNSISTDKIKAEDGWITTGMIGEGVIGTAQIADGSITDAKIVSLTADKIKAGTIYAERFILIQKDAEGNDQYYVLSLDDKTGNINPTKVNGNIIEERSITADRLVAGSITSNELAAKTILANNIASNTITSNEIAAGTITGTEIAANAIKTGNLDAFAVTSEKLASKAITADKIDAKAIMLSNLSDDVFDAVRDQVQDQVNQYRKEQEQWMNFDTDTGLTIGALDSNFAVNVSNDEIAFKQGNDTVAYINDQKLMITNAEVLNELRIGNYVFRPRANGNMSLIYEEAK